MKTLLFGIGIVLAVGIVAVAGYKLTVPPTEVGGEGGRIADICRVSTLAVAAVPSSASARVVASSTRAWTRLELVKDALGTATNSIALAFNGDVAATLASGILLSTTTPTIDFGRNTDFPYMGSVTGISSSGGTTVRVTSCDYAS